MQKRVSNSLFCILFRITTIHTCTCTTRSRIYLISILLPPCQYFLPPGIYNKIRKKEKKGNERRRISTEKSEQYHKRRLFSLAVSSMRMYIHQICELPEAVFSCLKTFVDPYKTSLFVSATVLLAHNQTLLFSSSASLVSLQLLYEREKFTGINLMPLSLL